MAKKCPRCGNTKEFYVSAHVVQDWKVDNNGNFIKSVNDCVEVTHFPNNEDVWECANCHYDGAGSRFETD